MRTRILQIIVFFQIFLYSNCPLIGQSIFENQITGTNPNTSNPYTIDQTFDPNITVSGIGRGTGINGTAANNRYNANGWDSGSFDANDYFYFTITPHLNYSINFSSFDFTVQRSNASLNNFDVRSSIDNYASSVGTFTYSGTTASLKSIDLSALQFQAINSTISFRIYAWGASASTTTFSINDFVFKGVVCTSPSSLTYTASSISTCQDIAILSSTVSSITGTSPFTYTISPTLPSGLSIDMNTGEISGTPTSPAVAADYTVTATNACGSTNAIVTITVNPTPSTPTITAGGPTTFCAGGSVTLTSSATSGNQWYKDGNLLSGETNQAYSANSSGDYTVVVTSNGCESSPSIATTITVNPIPSTPTITAGGPTTFCTGGSVTLTSSATSGNQWYKDSNLLSGETNQNYSANTSGDYTVVVTSNGCSATSTPTVITVNPLPNPTISGALSFCQGSSSTLTASGGASYLWDDNSTDPSRVVNTASTFLVTVTDGNMCTNSAMATTSFTSPNSNTTSGIFESYVVINGQYYDLQNETANPNFHGAALGVFVTGGTLTFSGGQIKTYKNSGDNICVGKIWYTVWPSTGGPGAFNSVNLPFNADLSNPGDQQWGTEGNTTNLLSTLSAGTYNIAVYVDASGNTNMNTVCSCDPFKVEDNAGNYWIANFVVCDAPNSFSYSSSSIATCLNTAITPNAAMISGTSPFIFTVSPNLPTGLEIDMNTGEISGTPTTSAASADYTVTATNACGSTNAIVNITVNPTPTASITYPDSPYCSNASDPSPSLIGTSGGTYTSSSGLSIDNSTGVIDLSTSTAGTYTVTYTVAANGGCPEVTATTSVTITTLPTSSITYIDSPYCSNGSDPSPSLTGTSGGIYTSTSGLSIDNSTGVIDLSASTAGTYTVTYTIATAGGCPEVTAATSVTINTPPTASITSTSEEICYGDVAKFTIMGTVGAELTYHFNSDANQTVILTGGSVVLTVNGATTNQSCTLVSVTNLNCTTILTQMETVLVNPVITSATLTGTPTICIGESTDLTLTIVGGTSPFSITYGPSNGFPIDDLDNIDAITVSPTSSTDYELFTVIDSKGCEASMPTSSASVTVNSPQTVSVSIVSNDADNTICAGTPVTFTATPINGGTMPTYQWKLNGDDVGSFINTFMISNLMNGDQISVVLTSNQSCVVSNTATSNTITTNVITHLPVSVSIASDDPDNSICAGTPVTFTATPVNGGTMPSYQWKVSGNNVGMDQNTYTTSTLSSTDIVSVVLTSNEMCTTSNPATSNMITTTVLPNENPGTITGLAYICSGQGASYTTDGNAGGIWESDDTNIATVDNSGNVTYVGDGTFTLSYTLSVGCGTPISATKIIEISQTACDCTPPNYTFIGGGTDPTNPSDPTNWLNNCMPNTNDTNAIITIQPGKTMRGTGFAGSIINNGTLKPGN